MSCRGSIHWHSLVFCLVHSTKHYYLNVIVIKRVSSCLAGAAVSIPRLN